MSNSPLVTGPGAIVVWLALSTAALAQPPHGPHPHFQEMDADGNGAVSRAEARAFAEGMALAADADGNGVVTAAELQAHREARRRERLEQRLARQDANGDGVVTVDEFTQTHVERLFERDQDGDGEVSPAEMRPPHRRGERRPGPGRG